MLITTTPSENSLLHEIEMFRTYIHDSVDLFSSHSSDGRFVYVSPASQYLLGFESNELLGVSIYDLCHPEDSSKIESLCDRNLPQTERIFYRIRKKEGDYIWFETTRTLLVNKKDRDGFFCISRDVTALMVAEKALKENEERYRLLVENFQDTVGIVTVDGFWIHMNNTGRKLFGVTDNKEMIGKCLFHYIHPNEKKNATNEIVQYYREATLECTLLRSDGQQKYVEIKFIPTLYRERETYQVVIRDLTERKKTEHMMQRAEQLHVVGQLAAGIAHEIRNPLTTIKGFTQLLIQDEPNKYLDVVMQEIERVEEIISDLLLLAKPPISTFEEVDMRKILNDTIKLFYSESLLHNIEIIQEIQLTNSIIKGEANKLKQVYINLIKNAIEAMPNGGKVLIKATNVNETVIITEVIDEGIGIPVDRIKRLGEPFYSTKEKGTGLGLMICDQIIKNHRGTFKVHSIENKGTIITIQLPKNMDMGKKNNLPIKRLKRKG
ncbi:PAS domain S-box protein [Lederbergia citrea]|uniref:PAS domain S-box protein n=1 Tax=Lederbergia citrea TaxID=2833581 RepID=UPI001BC9052F|nr:PAS domain S-box protein [Lederbergia citrea]